MKLSEIADRILILLNMDTDHAMRGVVEDYIIDARALIIKQDSNRKLQHTELYLQDTGFINLVPSYENIDCDYESCDVLRSEVEISTPIRAFTSPFYQVYDASGMTYDYVRRFSRTQYRRFSKHVPQYFWDKYLYVRNVPHLRNIRLQYIAHDPRELDIFKTCDGNTCDLEEQPFPIDTSILERIYQIVFQKLSYTMPQDNEIKIDEDELNRNNS